MRQSGSYIDRFLSRLTGVGTRGDGWFACCPSHGDETPSLDIDVGQNGGILLQCRSAKCTVDQIVESMGLKKRDLFPRKNEMPYAAGSDSSRTGKRRTVNTRAANRARKQDAKPIVQKETGLWEYVDEVGETIYATVRLEPGRNGKPKDYRQKRAIGWGLRETRSDGSERLTVTHWEKNLDGVTIVPYRFKSLLDAAETGSTAPLFIVEGEKCVDALVSLGLDATTNPMGAEKFGMIKEPQLKRAFTGRRVVILPDNDIPGWNHSEDVTRRLAGIAGSVVRVCLPGLPPKGDVFDWLKAGGTKEQLMEYVENPPPEIIPSESATPNAASVGHETDELSETTEEIGVANNSRAVALIESPHAPRKDDAAGRADLPAAGDDEPGDAEAIDDPHRLARACLESYQHPDGLTLRFWRGEFHEWRYGSYSVRYAPDTLRPAVTDHSKAVVDRLFTEFVENGQIDLSKKPDVPAITRGKIGDTLQAMSGITARAVPIVGDQPMWLGDDQPFPKLNHIVATRNKLIYLPGYFENWTEASPNVNLDAVIPATPKFFSPAASPFDFDPASPKPEAWAAFIQSIWGKDRESAKCLQEWFGYLLTPDTSRQKILLVVGPRRSGKGTIIEVLTNLVGEINTVATSLDALSESFVLEDWIGKTVAVVADSRDPDGLSSGAIVERLLNLSGGDRVRVNRKGIKAITTRLHARIVMFTNEIPRFYDSSEALASRFVILRMTESFLGNEDTKLADKLRAEMPSILKWAMQGWRRLQTQKNFTMPESAREIVEEMADIASPIAAFVRQRCQVSQEFVTSAVDLFNAWETWCKDNHHTHAGTTQTFAKKLRAAVPTISKERPRANSSESRPSAYRGIRVVQDSPFGLT